MPRRCAAGFGEPGRAYVIDAGQEPRLGTRDGKAGEGGAQACVLALEDPEVLAVAGITPASEAEEPVAGGAENESWVNFSRLGRTYIKTLPY